MLIFLLSRIKFSIDKNIFIRYDQTMKLSDYLELKKQKAYKFCRENNLNQAMVYDYLRGKRKLLVSSALVISQATGGAVRVEELT